jgi:hypothetical protein
VITAKAEEKDWFVLSWNMNIDDVANALQKENIEFEFYKYSDKRFDLLLKNFEVLNLNTFVHIEFDENKKIADVIISPNPSETVLGENWINYAIKMLTQKYGAPDQSNKTPDFWNNDLFHDLSYKWTNKTTRIEFSAYIVHGNPREYVVHLMYFPIKNLNRI